jgi:hypothetical protein
MILPIIIMIAITAIFVNRVVHYTNKFAHDCNRHELYFEDELSRGLFCSICNRNISIEYYSEKKGQ